MDELVNRLKQARQDKQLSLKEISDQTKIQVRYLEALEKNDYSVFAGEVYLKGAICNYAEIVGLDMRETLALYHSLKSEAAAEPESQASSPEPEARKPLIRKLDISKSAPARAPAALSEQAEPARRKPVKPITSERRGPSLTAGVVVLVLLIIAAGVWFSLNYPGRDAAVEPDPAELPGDAAPGEGDGAVDEEKPPPEVAFVSSSAEETVFALHGFAEIELTLNFVGGCWVQLVVDGAEPFYPRTFGTGEVYVTTAAERAWVRMGNPRGVRITVNGVEIEENRELLHPHNLVFTLE